MAHESFVREPGSYRDPAGFVYYRDGALYRQINAAGIDNWRAFLFSGLFDLLVGRRWLVGHQDASITDAATGDASAVIRPHVVNFIAYPYEWTFGQLKDAALLTLDVQLESLAAGWTLKDASGYNVAFEDGRPILIDSLSFEPYDGRSPWVAYRQFCEHFLAPLALQAKRDVRLSVMLKAYPDGLPLDLVTKLLPWRARLDFGLLSHLYLHARSQRRHAAKRDDGAAARGARIEQRQLVNLLRNLRNTVSALQWDLVESE